MSSSPETDSKREGDGDYLEELELYNNSTFENSYNNRDIRNEPAEGKPHRIAPLSSQRQGFTDKGYFNGLLTSKTTSVNVRELDLSFTSNSKKQDSYDDAAAAGIQEKMVNVVFDLPDGSQGENSFKLGHTVEVLKSFIENEYGIPMADQSLFLDAKPMFDPFSLLDYPETKGTDEIYVRVEGSLPQSSRK